MVERKIGASERDKTMRVGQDVQRRRVFYVPGYDPIHPRRYRELYRSEGAKQGQISDYDIELSARQGGENYGWNVKSRMEGKRTETEFDVLVWSDIVRDSMDLNIPQTYLMMLRTAWTYISTGTLRRLRKLRRGPIIAALYPVIMLIVQLLAALLAGHLLGKLGSFLVSFLPFGVVGSRAGVMLSYWVLFALVVIFLLRWFRRIDHKLYIYYLMHDYSYSAQYGGRNPDELEGRIAEFVDKLAAALNEDLDEVLLVGHSSGAFLGVSIMADLMRSGRIPENGPKLGFLSLGQVVPMVSFLPAADRLRRDLHDLSLQDQITWIDVSAPGDGAAFALCDPVSVSGVAPKTGKRWPIVFSAAFTKTLTPEHWKSLRWRFFRRHFQYLCAFDYPGDYDYFRVTAGPLSLAERYKNRGSSSSRIETAHSKYTSMAP